MFVPGSFPIEPGENIGLAVASSLASVVEANFRVVYENGDRDLFTISRFTSGSERGIELFGSRHVAKRAGRIVSGALNPFTSLKRGQFYYQMLVGMRIGEVDGRITRQAMGQGYLYDMSPAVLGWFRESGPGGGNGVLRSIALANPAADAEYADETAPTNAAWVIRSFNGQLVADATGANRDFRLEITDGTNVFATALATRRQTASQTMDYFGTSSPGRVDTVTSPNNIDIALDPRLVLPEGYVISFNTRNRQTGDNWGAGRLGVEEWVMV